MERGRKTALIPQTRGAQQLLLYLERQDLSQSEFAGHTHMSPSRLNHLLQARRRPSLEDAFAIQRATTGFVRAEMWLEPVAASSSDDPS